MHSDRDAIPDAPAIYFCAPTEENLGRIAQDLQNAVYDAYHMNFISPISRQRLEDLAAAALQAGSVASIKHVFDQYMNFITLEDDMFVLRHQNSEALSYYALNRANTQDAEMESITDAMVDSLFAVCVTLAAVPVIRAPRGTAAEWVARKLDKRLRENLWDARNNLFHAADAVQTGAAGASGAFAYGQRPLLLLLDRNMDMATALHHTWTYQALAHDVMELSLNRVQVPDDAAAVAVSGGARSKRQTCDLDGRDKFWRQHKGSPFPAVAEAIQEELESYRSSEEEIKRLKQSMGLTDGSGSGVAADSVAYSLVTDNTERLTSAVNSLPQLMEQKRLIDQHTRIATAILSAIKARRLDSFFELEEKIMSKLALDRPLLEVLGDVECGQPEDRMRLLVIYYICCGDGAATETEVKRMEALLTEQGCDMAALAYVRRWK